MKLTGSCHCGATKFEVNMAPTSVKRCTCSICSKLGVLWAYYKPENFKLQERPRCETTYRWNTKAVAFKFCSACGCGTYAETFGWATGDGARPMISVNARLFDDFDLDAVPIDVIDGKNLW